MAQPTRAVQWVLGPAPGACPPFAVDGRPDAGPPPGRTAADRSCQRWTLGLVCLASALLLINVTAPNVALPDIGRSLGASFGALRWVLAAYSLVLASLLLVGGALGDRLGRRRLFLVGLAGFGLASVLCALAPSPAALVGARALQGLGAALLFPAALALIATEYVGPERAQAIGVWGASVSGAIALGPLIGGVLVDTTGWRGIFWLDVVLALPAGILAARHLRESRTTGAAGVDWAGATVLTAASFLLVLGLQLGVEQGWGSAVVLGSFAGAAVLLAAFPSLERRMRDPLIDPALLRNRTFVAVTFVALVFAASGFAPLVYITLFLLDVLDQTPIQTGLELLPFAVTSFAVSLAAAGVAARVGLRATLAGGLGLIVVALLLLRGVRADASWARLIPGLIVFGVGAGLVNPTMTVAALSAVPPSQSGLASGVNNTARQLGIAAGIAGLGAVLEAKVGADPARASGAAYVDGLDAVFLASALIAGLGAILVVAVVRPARAASAAR